MLISCRSLACVGVGVRCECMVYLCEVAWVFNEKRARCAHWSSLGCTCCAHSIGGKAPGKIERGRNERWVEVKSGEEPDTTKLIKYCCKDWYCSPTTICL